jgi:hypothetical protein
VPLGRNKARECADYCRVFCRERENRRLAGGEGRIRTPETLQDSRGGIQPEFGALFGPNKSIRAGENLFALDSALLRISPVPFVR